MEKVNTGGLTSIEYPRGYKPERDYELEGNIERSYEIYYARKRKQKIIKISIIVFILLLLGVLKLTNVI